MSETQVLTATIESPAPTEATQPKKEKIIDPNGLIDTAHKAAQLGLSEATLVGWRYRDKLAGRTQAQPGFPKYFRIGKEVRYLPYNEFTTEGGTK